MIFLVDTVTVDGPVVDEYVRLLHEAVVPLMERAGARFEFCRSSGPDLGEPVDVQVAWSFADNAAWNDIRRQLVLDPAFYDSAARLAELRRGGTRRFYRPIGARP